MIKAIGMVLLLGIISNVASAGPLKKLMCDIHPKSEKCIAAPEMDPSSGAAALTLLAGGLAVMLARRAKN